MRRTPGKCRRRFTLNYGLRYEKSFLPQPTVVDPNYPQTGHIPLYSKDFAPRLSLSYSLDDRTVIRAGYGIFYARFLGNGLDTLFLGNGRYQTSISANATTAGAPVFPNVVPNAASVPAGTVNLTLRGSEPLPQPLHPTGNHRHRAPVGPRYGAHRQLHLEPRRADSGRSRDLNLGSPTTTGTYTIQDAGGNTVGACTTPLWIAASKPDTAVRAPLRSGQRRPVLVQRPGPATPQAHVARAVDRRLLHLVARHRRCQPEWRQRHHRFDAIDTCAGNYRLDKGSSPLDQRHRAVDQLPVGARPSPRARRPPRNTW